MKIVAVQPRRKKAMTVSQADNAIALEMQKSKKREVNKVLLYKPSPGQP